MLVLMMLMMAVMMTVRLNATHTHTHTPIEQEHDRAGFRWMAGFPMRRPGSKLSRTWRLSSFPCPLSCSALAMQICLPIQSANSLDAKTMSARLLQGSSAVIARPRLKKKPLDND